MPTLMHMRTHKLPYKWLVALVAIIGAFMSSLDQTGVNIAIPNMQSTFGTSIQNIQWVLTSYMLTQAAVIPLATYMINNYGSKQTYVWTQVAFTVGSFLCSIAWSLPSLIFFRICQGIGGGILLPLVMTLLFQEFPPEERGTAFGLVSLPLLIAPAIGPLIGGYLVTFFGWQWVFLINIPIGILAIVCSQNILHHSSLETPTRFDIPGFLSIAYSGAALLYGVAEGAATTWNNRIALFFCISGLCSLIAFLAIERYRIRKDLDLLLDIRLFLNHSFLGSTIAMVFVNFVLFGILFLLPVYLQALRSDSPLQAGTLLLTQTFAVMVSLPIGGRLADKLGPRKIVIAGLVLLIGAIWFLTALDLNTSTGWLIVRFVLLGLAFGLTQPLSVLAMAQIHQYKEIANGSTLISVLRAFAAPIGVAALSTIIQVQSPIRTSQFLHGYHGDLPLSPELLRKQGILLAMHDGFFLSALLVIFALIAVLFIRTRPPRILYTQDTQ